MRRPIRCPLLAISPIFVSLLLCLRFPGLAEAQCSWDLAADFISGSTNPFAGAGAVGACGVGSPPWSLRSEPPATLLTNSTSTYFSTNDLFAYQGSDCQVKAECLPAVVKNVGASGFAWPYRPSIFLPPGEVILRASSPSTGVLVQWAAPRAANYTFSITLNQSLPAIATFCDTYPWRIKSGLFTSFQAVNGSAGQLYSDGGPRSLVAGEAIFLDITSTGAVECDSWFVKFTVTEVVAPAPTPPPSSTPPPTTTSGSVTTAATSTAATTSSATTSPAPQPPATTTGVLVVTQPEVVSDGWTSPAVIVFNGGTIISNGTAIIDPNSEAQVTVPVGQPDDGTTRVVLVTATDAVTGTFGSVVVTGRKGCNKYSTAQENDGKALSVLLTSRSSACRSKRTLIVALVAGIVGAVAILLILLIIFRRPVQDWARTVCTPKQESYVK